MKQLNLNLPVYLQQSLPFWAVIPGGCTPGTLVLIVGRITTANARFSVNFVAGNTLNPYEADANDVALHFNPRFRESCVVRNTRQHGTWGKEERLPKDFLPMTAGSTFELLFLVQPEGFKVAVNGKHFIEYKHRIAYQLVGLLKIEGEVVVERVNFSHEPSFPIGSVSHRVPFPGNVVHGSPIPGMVTTLPYPPLNQGHPIGVNPPSAGASPIQGIPIHGTPINGPPVLYNPIIPLVHKFERNLYVGQTIFISGRPLPAFDTFRIDFVRSMTGNSDDSNAEIALHFSVRRREKAVVRNSWIAGLGWGSEERASPSFPFHAGVNFDIMIRVEGNRFQVSINGLHFIDFGHRVLPVNSINLFQIKGDVSITTVRFS